VCVCVCVERERERESQQKMSVNGDVIAVSSIGVNESSAQNGSDAVSADKIAENMRSVSDRLLKILTDSTEAKNDTQSIQGRWW
jgi:hypothetical protein